VARLLAGLSFLVELVDVNPQLEHLGLITDGHMGQLLLQMRPLTEAEVAGEADGVHVGGFGGDAGMHRAIVATWQQLLGWKQRSPTRRLTVLYTNHETYRNSNSTAKIAEYGRDRWPLQSATDIL
jgi:hypothetical protein